MVQKKEQKPHKQGGRRQGHRISCVPREKTSQSPLPEESDVDKMLAEIKRLEEVRAALTAVPSGEDVEMDVEPLVEAEVSS